MNKESYKSVLVIFLAATAMIGATFSAFSSSAEINNNVFATGTWPDPIIINEVYYDTGSHSLGAKIEKEGDNEWVELYNSNAYSINLKNYTLTNQTSAYTINANVLIPANGYALLSHDHDTWIFWSEPAGTLKLNLGGNPGDDWLINEGDRLTLKNSSGLVVGAVSWGTDTTYCNLSTVSEGSSLSYTGPGACNYVETNPPTPGG